jgi:ABC-type amino acid transport substrate-binding protein
MIRLGGNGEAPVSEPTLSPFPIGFQFGVATADHQCEAYVERWAEIRDEWERVRGLQRRQEATDFWDRYVEDVRLASSLGCKAFRLSLSWARLEPSPGAWDTNVKRHYADLLTAIHGAGMKTIVTLHHNTWPLHVQTTGDGMLDTGFPDLFAAYARQVAQDLGELIDYYVTINEPNQLIYGYIKGFWMRTYPMPPGLDPFVSEAEQMRRVLKLIPNLFLAHSRARREIQKLHPNAMVGSNPLILGVPKWVRSWMDWQATKVKRPEDVVKQAVWLTQRGLVANGDVDISIAQLTMTDSRMDKVLFSEPYFAGRLVALHVSGTVLPPSFETWAGRVGVTQQTAPAAMAESHFPNAAIKEYKNTGDAIAGLRAGEIDLVFDDDIMLQQYAVGYSMTVLPAPVQFFAVAMPLGSRSLLNAVDLALRQFKDLSNGMSLWQQAVAVHLPGAAPVCTPDAKTTERHSPISDDHPLHRPYRLRCRTWIHRCNVSSSAVD